MPSAHAAAVEAMAGAMFDAVYGGSSGMDEMLEAICRDNARIALAALVRSEAVRVELVEAIWQRWEADLDDWDLEGSMANAQAKALAADALLAALAPEAT